MTDVAVSTSRELRILPILRRSWLIYAAKFMAFTLVGIVVAVPHLRFGGAPQSIGGAAQTFVVVIVSLILQFLAQAVILYGAFQAMVGRPVMIGDAIRRGFARFWPIVGVSILVGLGIFVGLFLFIIPGFILAVRWAVALPACVVENIGPLAAMRRSAELTKGHRWKVLILAFAIIGAFAVRVVAAPEGLGQLILDGINVIVSGIVTAYFNVVAAMVYRDLRTLKDGVGMEEIAAVFD